MLMDKYVGETEKLSRALFTLAQKLQPCIIFIDEIDALCRERTHTDQAHTRNQKSEFLTLWDGLMSKEDNRVIVIGATNRERDIDPAFSRRLTLKYAVAIPNLEQRAQIIRVILKTENVHENFDYFEAAKLSEGFTGSDLKELCRAAAMAVVLESVSKERQDGMLPQNATVDLRPIETADFVKARQRFHHSKKK
jgi:SpoVK/Ycf46/Vps4 family AAA+-type ATPase